MYTDLVIKVNMLPKGNDNPHKPYFWCILSYNNKGWSNEGSGWSDSPEKAFSEAKDYLSAN